MRERVAVIGAGVAGLSAAYLLQRRYDVTLYESEARLGGHAHTHDVASPDAGALAVDSGFIVHNTTTYPLLTRLFDELGITTQPTQMSMSIRCEECDLEYAGARGVSGLLARPAVALRPRFVRMLGEVRKFHRHAQRVLVHCTDEMTLREFLLTGRYSTYFVGHFMVPVVSSVWSSPPQLVLEYPARYLFAFLRNHGMLSVFGSHEWRTVVGGSQIYVARAVKHLTAVATATPVRAIQRHADGVTLRDDADDSVEFDRVVVATHADTARLLLSDPTPQERAVLGAFSYTSNDTVLHTDDRVLPRAPRAQAGWNYLLPACRANADRVVVSYDMTRLQRLPTDERYVVTLNATERIEASRVVARMRYEHPVYTTRSVRAQRRLPDLTTPRCAFAGAYHGWGFHEDGCRAGVAAAAAFGVSW